MLAACNKGPWTEEEDRLILERVQEHGTKWAKISGMYLPDRPENDIKNRWHILVRMSTHGGPVAPLAAASAAAAGLAPPGPSQSHAGLPHLHAAVAAHERMLPVQHAGADDPPPADVAAAAAAMIASH